jgi:hypothetical protein
VSCGSARYCVAGGYGAPGGQAFVVSERNGRWAKAIEVAGGLNSKDNGDAGVNSVSCRVAGDCAAGGAYIDSGGGDQPFVVSERNGRWGKAVQLAAGVYGTVLSVSCASAGYCTAGGFRGSAGPSKAFVVSERNGRWGNALEIPGWGELNTERYVGVNSLSCPSPGNCAAGGPYYDRSGAGQAFVASEVNGHWANAIEVPGSAALNTGGNAHVAAVSCATAGQCAAGGSYYVGSGTHLGAQSFVASQK